ncbi:MAG: spore coat protein CotJB [Clostridia bacterium]|nr:spore coat protein CotJB [Clostridia bacterium]
MNERNKLMARLSAVQFAAWELHVYLDTHPCDTAANETYRKYTAEAAVLKKEYEGKYGPLTITASTEADWICDPWPWENERCCD